MKMVQIVLFGCLLALGCATSTACAGVNAQAKALLTEINENLMPEYVETTDSAYKKNDDGTFAPMFDADQRARRHKTAERIDAAVKALDAK